MTSLWLVTPAWRRYALSDVCFEQHKRALLALQAAGIDAQQVVVADDENVDIARGKGFHVVEQNNDWLGRRFNDGIEYAARNGADWIVPIGSDSWIDPAYFLPLPHWKHTRTGTAYAMFTSEGGHTLAVPEVGPYMIHKSRLRSSLRPARDDINQGVDRSTLQGLRSVVLQVVNLHELQYVAFRGETYLSSHKSLVTIYGVKKMTWEDLDINVFNKDLIEAVQHAGLDGPNDANLSRRLRRHTPQPSPLVRQAHIELRAAANLRAKAAALPADQEAKRERMLRIAEIRRRTGERMLAPKQGVLRSGVTKPSAGLPGVPVS